MSVIAEHQVPAGKGRNPSGRKVLIISDKCRIIADILSGTSSNVWEQADRSREGVFIKEKAGVQPRPFSL